MGEVQRRFLGIGVFSAFLFQESDMVSTSAIVYGEYCDWPEDSGIHSFDSPTPGNITGHVFAPRDDPDAGLDLTAERTSATNTGNCSTWLGARNGQPDRPASARTIAEPKDVARDRRGNTDQSRVGYAARRGWHTRTDGEPPRMELARGKGAAPTLKKKKGDIRTLCLYRQERSKDMAFRYRRPRGLHSGVIRSTLHRTLAMADLKTR